MALDHLDNEGCGKIRLVISLDVKCVHSTLHPFLTILIADLKHCTVRQSFPVSFCNFQFRLF